MRTCVAVVTLLLAPAVALAEDGRPHRDDLGAAEEAAAVPRPPTAQPLGFPAPVLDVAQATGVPGLSAGGSIGPGIELELTSGACVRLVAASAAAVLIRGPARVSLRREGTGVSLDVTSGSGALFADGRGAGVVIAAHNLTVRGGAAAFDTAREAVARLLEGEAELDGTSLEPNAAAEAAELSSHHLCMPPRPVLALPLGNPETLVTTAEQARASEAESDSQSNTAEGGATCVDSTSTSSATDPTEGPEGGVDPDARRDAGRLRVIVRVPARSR